MKELIKNLKPDTFEDIIALVALFRHLCNRAWSKTSSIVSMVEKWCPTRSTISTRVVEADSRAYLRHYLVPGAGDADRSGLAGYTLGGADLLRRAMGKKKPEEMAKQRSVFKRAKEKGVNRIPQCEFLTSWRNSRATALTNRTRPPMRWCLIKQRG